MSAVVGFSGSRSLPVFFAPLVAGVVASVVRSGRSVVVGCAPGADAFVRSAAPGASVLSVASGAWGSASSPAAWARRSAAVVGAAVAGGGGSGFVGFVVGPCPAGVLPAGSWRAGSPASGSWSSLALAAGLGLPVVVFWCAPGAPVLPAWAGGSWAPAGSGVWAGAWRWAPAWVAVPLFSF